MSSFTTIGLWEPKNLFAVFNLKLKTFGTKALSDSESSMFEFNL